MTTLNATICYSETTSLYPRDDNDVLLNWNDSLRDVLEAWAEYGVAGNHGSNTGGFYTNGVDTTFSFTGDTYSMSNADYAFSVHGDLSYYFYPLTPHDPDAIHNHTLHGRIDSISFGGGLDAYGNVEDPFLTICFDDPVYGDLADGHASPMHDAIWSLMNGELDGYPSSQGPGYGGLFALLEEYGFNLDASIASQGTPFDNCDCDSELVGLPEFDDYLLAA